MVYAAGSAVATIMAAGLTLAHAPTAGAASTALRGVGAWYTPTASSNLIGCGADWFYTWAPDLQWITKPDNAEFVPCIRDPSDLTTDSLAQATKNGTTLLTFNEPDRADQANMSVAAALAAWPQLQATRLRLGSPAVAADPAKPGGWLDQFLTGSASRGYRVDFIAVHWYGWQGTVAATTASLAQTLEAVHQRYRKPLWLTEFAAVEYRLESGGMTAYAPPPATQASFLRSVAAMLATKPYVERYSWFALAPTPMTKETALFTDAGSMTAVGSAFRALA